MISIILEIACSALRLFGNLRRAVSRSTNSDLIIAPSYQWTYPEKIQQTQVQSPDFSTFHSLSILEKSVSQLRIFLARQGSPDDSALTATGY
jgi:hypothetical protein